MSMAPFPLSEAPATRFPSMRTKVSLGRKPRRLTCTVPSPMPTAILEVFWLRVAPISCGNLLRKSVALRTPNFSMSTGRYVSTGFGPVSSAVGICEPVTITRSTSATPEGAVSCANAFGTKTTNIPQLLLEQRDRILREPGRSFQTQTDPTNTITQVSAETFNPKGDSPGITATLPTSKSAACHAGARAETGFVKNPNFPRNLAPNFL